MVKMGAQTWSPAASPWGCWTPGPAPYQGPCLWWGLPDNISHCRGRDRGPCGGQKQRANQ
jgi:hypothetical protein